MTEIRHSSPDEIHPTREKVSRAGQVVRCSSLAAAGLSLCPLFGRAMNLPFLCDLGFSNHNMVAETSFGTLLAAAALWIAGTKNPGPSAPIAGLILLFGFFNLAIRSPLLKVRPDFFVSWPQLEVGKGAAFAFTLFSLGILLLARTRKMTRVLWQAAALGAAVSSIGLVTLMLFISGLYLAPFWKDFFFRMSFPSALVCVLLGTGLIALYLQTAAESAQTLSVTAAALAIAALLFLFGGVYPAVLQSSDYLLENRLHTPRMRDAVDATRGLVALSRDAESAQRGYLLTRDPENLEAFRSAQSKLTQIIRGGAVSDARSLQMAQQIFKDLEKPLESEQRGRHEEALRLEKSSHALHSIDGLEGQVQIATDRIQAMLAIRRNGGLTSLYSVRKMILCSCGFSVLFVCSAMLLAATELRRRSRMEHKLRENQDSLAMINAALREQTARAEDASTAKSRFLSSMSHEIRTPMNAILGMADMLWESELSETQRHYVEVFRRAGGNLLALINHILDLSKIESGSFCLETVDFHLRELVEQVIEILTPNADSKSLSLIAHIEPGTASSVVGDPVRLQQVLLNLLGNAIKFTDRGKVLLRIHSSSTATHASLTFEVSDSGIGIAPEKLQLIFDDFAQAEASTTRRFGGTGLGLSISKRLVTLMGGDLQVRSEIGRGSTFSFTIALPIGVEQPSPAAIFANDIHGKTVLIVDNAETNRVVLSGMCSSLGMVVTACGRGAEAVEAVRSSLNVRPFALALVDRMMPGLDGFETARQIQLLDPTITILLISSDTQSGDVARCRELGLAGHLMKPVRRAELLQKIAKSLGVGPEPDPAPVPEKLKLPVDVRKQVQVLVAEDSEDNRFLLNAYCKGTIYDLTFAADGESALAAYQGSHFDLILMDVQMPVMDGLTATTRIREIEDQDGRKRLPILALTANALQQDVTKALEAGCDAHLAKPINRQAFLLALETWRPTPPPVASPPIQLEIPEGLEELARSYLAARQQELTRLQSLLKHSAFGDLRELGHNMKGSGTSFGFPDITRLGGIIERASKNCDAAELAVQLAELSTYLDTAGKKILSI